MPTQPKLDWNIEDGNWDTGGVSLSAITFITPMYDISVSEDKKKTQMENLDKINLIISFVLYGWGWVAITSKELYFELGGKKRTI